MNDKDFDLLIHDWIPCLDLGGTSKLHGIRSALKDARQIRSIEHESPAVRVATLRLLLAFCYRMAHSNGLPLSSFRNWRTLHAAWKEGIPPEWMDRYLDGYHCRDRFRLFDETHPFFQVAELRCTGSGQPEPATRLAFEQFAGTPSSLWEHIREAPTVPEAALYLVMCQAFGASASNTSKALIDEVHYSPSGRTFAPTYKGCIVWLEGQNLLETLMLNLVDYDLTDTDFPIWERPLIGEALRARQPRKARDGAVVVSPKQARAGTDLGGYRRASPTGPVQLFTWPSRAVLLSEPKKGRVETIHFTQGLPLGDEPVDPMKPYDGEGNAIGLKPDKSAWRDLHSLLAIQPGSNRTVMALSHGARSGLAVARLNVAGVARKELAKILFWRHERMPVSAALLANVSLIERLGKLLSEAEAVGDRLSRGLFQVPGGKVTRNEPVGRIQAIADLMLAPSLELKNAGVLRTEAGRMPSDAHNKAALSLCESLDPRPAYWTRLENHFFELLNDLANDWDVASEDWKPDQEQAATSEWRMHVKHEAQRSLEESISSLGTTARAIQAIARVRSGFSDGDLKPPTQKTNKTEAGRKGGKKP